KMEQLINNLTVDMIKAEDLKTGGFIKHNGFSCKILKKEAYPPEKDVDLIKIEMLNLDTGETITATYRHDFEIEPLSLLSKEMTFNQKLSDSFIFTNNDNNEQLEVQTSFLGESVSFLRDKAIVNVYYYKKIIASIELPKIVSMEIDFTEDIEKDSKNMEYIKDARLSNGYIIKVPAFIKTGDRVLIHLESRDYICRD
ncbi:MAG: hypothetical protein KKD38_10905, partial [Candidatus Delongbacteria bacterium]|nr:hypothetical protein [Candidatus Delongbacteria bacterium]